MRLKQVEIKNFRSIEDATIEFDPRCRILVGMNDTGKSNILKALSILQKETIGQKSDRREEAEEGNNDFYIKAIFTPDEHDYKEIAGILQKKIYDTNHDTANKILSFIENQTLQYHLIDYLNGEEREDSIIWEKRYSLRVFLLNCFMKDSEEWKNKKPVTTTVSDIVRSNIIKFKHSHRIKELSEIIKDINDLRKYDFVHNKAIASFPDIVQNTFWGNVGNEKIISIVNDDIKKWIEKELKVVVWKSGDPKHKISKNVLLEKFKQDPSNFLFMKNIFKLHFNLNKKFKSSYDNEKDDNAFIIKEIEKHNNDYDGTKFRTYLSHVIKTLNDNFKEIWKNYYCNIKEREENINFYFDLRYGSSNLQFTVNEIGKDKESNFYDIERRSDGFRKFIEFLLIVSSEVLCEDISNTLFLIDEPETSLHPSASRDFRKQLISISEKLENYVVYGTHAISMTDRKKLNRHYIIKRENRITSIESAEKVRQDKRNLSRGIVEHEILLHSVGDSPYENLQEKNIIFEGWTDKKLFKKYCEGNNVNVEKIGFGIAHVFGASTFCHVTPILELGGRDVLIISDCDEEALENQKKYDDKHGYGRWLTYQEIDKTITAIISAEDFLKKEFIVEQVNSYLEDKNLTTKNNEFFEESLSGKAHDSNFNSIIIWLTKNLHCGFSSKKIQKIGRKIKHQMFDELQYENILMEEYAKLHEGIKNAINKEPAPSAEKVDTSKKIKTTSTAPASPPSKTPPPNNQ